MGKKKTYEEGQRPWRDVSVFFGGPGRRWTLFASWIVIALVVAVCLVILFRPPADGPGRVSASTSSSSTAAPTDAPTADGPCEATSPDLVSDLPPKDLQWTVQYGNSWPTSDSVGPKLNVDGIEQCFDRSPVGAALAAVNIMQSIRTSDIATAHAIVNAQVIEGPGRDAMNASIDRTYPGLPPENRPWGRVMGYKVLAFTPDEARLLMVENWPQRGQYTGYNVTLKWVAGDWKFALTDEGRTSPDPDITVDPNGYTLWKAAE